MVCSILLKCTYIWYEEFEDIKGVIKFRKSKKDRQHNHDNGQKKKGQIKKQTTTQNTTQKTKDRAK